MTIVRKLVEYLLILDIKEGIPEKFDQR